MYRKLLLNCFVFFFGFSLQVNAADKITPWKPPVEEYDWVQLTSGEWLKGEIKAFYNRVLEFDSSKLNLLNIDWEDIQYLESHIDSIVRIEGHGVVTGKLQLAGDKVTITKGESTTEFNRNRLISFITGEVKESNYWSGVVSFGLNIRSGNTDQTDFLAKVNIKRRTSQTRLILDYSGSISSIDSVETTNNHRFNFSFDYFKTRNFFYKPIFGEYFRDTFQNLDYRISIGSGVGYTIIDSAKTEWNVSGGPSYLQTRYTTVQPGVNQTESNPSISFSTDYDTEYSKTLDIIAKYSIQLSSKNSGGLTHHADLTLKNEISDLFDLDISIIWDRTSNPKAGVNGNLPEKDDFKLVVGLGYDF